MPPGERDTATKVVEAFGLECGKEGLDQSIVIAVALAAHALLDALSLQQTAEGFAGVLASPI